MLDARYSMLDARGSMLEARCSILDAGGWMLDTGTDIDDPHSTDVLRPQYLKSRNRSATDAHR
ncbi:MAG: hypothetical protein AB1797_12985 [bacterium]